MPLNPLKIQKSPLIAHGGHSVSCAQLCDNLWPDADGDSAQMSFDVTLHRLRKLLGVPDAITCWNGRVNLNPEICWVDAWAFEQMVTTFDRKHLAGGTPDPTEAVDFQQFLDLYRGAFLKQKDEAWALSKREKLRAKFIRVVHAHAERCERRGETDHAAKIYERAFEADPGVVEFHTPVPSNPAGVDL
jgi:DNA-binding SARP family transcriptional activator